jgi:hypothetical protein
LASLFSDNAVPFSLCFEDRCLEEPDDMIERKLELQQNIETEFGNIY